MHCLCRDFGVMASEPSFRTTSRRAEVKPVGTTVRAAKTRKENVAAPRFHEDPWNA